MSVWQAIVMGIIQGLGEFLPISSSGHLVLVPWLLGWDVPGINFDIALHIGTLIAVLFYFWQDWLKLISAAVTRRNKEHAKLFWLLVIASIPAALAGLLFKDPIENSLRSPVIVGLMLIIFAFILYFSDKKKQIRSLDSMTIKDALFIGVAQAISLIPGVSRSGITMTVARLFSYSREEAARFTFMLSTPVIFGAGLMSIQDTTLSQITLPFIVGVVVSAIIGLLSISFLLKFLKKHSFNIFVGYRLLLGALIIMLSTVFS